MLDQFCCRMNGKEIVDNGVSGVAHSQGHSPRKQSTAQFMAMRVPEQSLVYVQHITKCGHQERMDLGIFGKVWAHDMGIYEKFTIVKNFQFKNLCHVTMLVPPMQINDTGQLIKRFSYPVSFLGMVKVMENMVIWILNLIFNFKFYIFMSRYILRIKVYF